MTSSHMGRRYIEEAQGRVELVQLALTRGLCPFPYFPTRNRTCWMACRSPSAAWNAIKYSPDAS